MNALNDFNELDSESGQPPQGTPDVHAVIAQLRRDFQKNLLNNMDGVADSSASALFTDVWPETEHDDLSGEANEPIEPAERARALGQFVQRWRKLRKLDLLHCAELTGISQPMLERLEAGGVPIKDISLEWLWALANALSVDYESLLIVTGRVSLQDEPLELPDFSRMLGDAPTQLPSHSDMHSAIDGHGTGPSDDDHDHRQSSLPNPGLQNASSSVDEARDITDVMMMMHLLASERISVNAEVAACWMAPAPTPRTAQTAQIAQEDAMPQASVPSAPTEPTVSSRGAVSTVARYQQAENNSPAYVLIEACVSEPAVAAAAINSLFRKSGWHLVVQSRIGQRDGWQVQADVQRHEAAVALEELSNILGAATRVSEVRHSTPRVDQRMGSVLAQLACVRALRTLIMETTQDLDPLATPVAFQLNRAAERVGETISAVERARVAYEFQKSKTSFVIQLHSLASAAPAGPAGTRDSPNGYADLDMSLMERTLV